MIRNRKTYYKVTDGDAHWTTDEIELKRNIISWILESDLNEIKIETIQMTPDEFENLGPYQ